MARISPSPIFKSVLVLSYAIGLICGDGLHLHESLSHKHDGENHHAHSWTAHVHPVTVVPAAHHDRQSILDPDHDHDIQVVHFVAVPPSTSRAQHLIQGFVVSPADLVKPFFSNVPTSFLFVLPHETSPPLLAQTDHPDSGRSPPAFS